jgi:hypothetical protein
MPGRETPRSRDPDDWFADFEPEGSRRERTRERPATPSARGSTPEADGDDGWLGDDLRSRLSRESIAASLPDRWIAIAALVLVVLILVGGFALAGGFGGSKPTPAPTTAPTSTPTTTASTTTQVLSTTVAAPATTLKPGDQGTQVKVLQRALAHLGYAVGKIDGSYGPATKTAVQRFQTAAKLTADGIFGTATRAALVTALKR